MKFCTNCGKNILETNKFCTNCGSKIDFLPQNIHPTSDSGKFVLSSPTKAILDSQNAFQGTEIDKLPNDFLEVSAWRNDDGVIILKYGFINRQGNWTIKPIFDFLGEFDDKDYSHAELNGKHGFINRQGNWIIQPMFDKLNSFENNEYSLAELNGKWGFINRQGNWIIQPIFDYLDQQFDDKDYCRAELNEKFGYVNRQGNWIIQPMFDTLFNLFDDKDYGVAEINGKWGFINRQGIWIIKPTFDFLVEFDDKDYCRATIDEKCGFVNRQGNWTIQPIFDYLDWQFDDKDFCKFKLREKFGYINRQGISIIQPIFDVLDEFDDKDYSLAELNGKRGFINRQGNWIIQPVFDFLVKFDDEDYCRTKLNGKWGFINRQGNWIIQPIFDDLFTFDDKEEFRLNLLNRKYDISKPIDKDDKDYCFAQLNGKWGVINRQGNWIIQPILDELEGVYDTKKDYIFASSNRKWGVINRQGNWIIQPILKADHLINLRKDPAVQLKNFETLNRILVLKEILKSWKNEYLIILKWTYIIIGAISIAMIIYQKDFFAGLGAFVVLSLISIPFVVLPSLFIIPRRKKKMKRIIELLENVPKIEIFSKKGYGLRAFRKVKNSLIVKIGNEFEIEVPIILLPIPIEDCIKTLNKVNN